MKLLVLGAYGMAGHVISIYFKERGYDVTAYTTRPFEYCNNIIGNALEQDSFKKMLLEGDYDVVINCIGILNQFAENNHSAAVYLNSYLPHLISDTLKDQKTKFIHMSTDCVFAGNKAPFIETSFADGATFYDRTKALGEVSNSKDLTFRNSIIGADINEKGIGLFNWFMKQDGDINGFTKAIWTGVTTLTLAKAMEQAIKEDLSGLYNLVNNSSINKYELLLLFNKHFKNNSLNISPLDSLVLDKTLECSRNSEFSFTVPSYEQMVIEMKEWVYNHKELYAHYFKIR